MNTNTKRLKKLLLELAETTDNARIKLESAKLLIMLRQIQKDKEKVNPVVAHKVDPELADILGIDKPAGQT